jgi:hypothetical protein
MSRKAADWEGKVEPAMLLSSILDRREDSEAVAVPPARDPIEQQILAAGTISEAQVEAIRGFQRRKGLTFGHAAITLGLVRRESLLLALSKHYNYPVLGFGSANTRISRELVAGYQPFSAAAEAYRSVRSALVTGSLSQGKNAFAVIGARSKVGVTSFAANLALSFAQMAVPTLLVDANLRRPRLTGPFWSRQRNGRLGRGADHSCDRIIIHDRRCPPLSVAVRRGGDSASSAGASDLQGIPDAIAKRAAQLRCGDLRYATGFGERRCLCRGVACRFGDPSGSPTPNESQRHREHHAHANGSSVRDCRHGPPTPVIFGTPPSATSAIASQGQRGEEGSRVCRFRGSRPSKTG